ncbi:hypothetical protein H0H92_001983 [Tricholoma furcatifolium]|nr:hypothetical protein H0H92_001983 [Tricholoma furcatifolium]
MDTASAISHLHDNRLSMSKWLRLDILVTSTIPSHACLEYLPNPWVYLEQFGHFLGVLRDIPYHSCGPVTGPICDFNEDKVYDVEIFLEHACQILTDNRPSLTWLRDTIFKGKMMPSGYLQEGLDEHLWQLLLDCQVKSRRATLSTSEIVQRLEWAGNQWDIAVQHLGKKRQKIASLLTVIFGDKQHYRCLLSCDKDKAQKLLDTLQLLLDIEYFPELNRREVIAALQRFLNRQKDLYPVHFFIDSPTSAIPAIPAATGGFADIYRVKSHQVETCFKVIRMYQQPGVEHLTKLYAKEAIVWAQLSHPNILPFFGISKFQTRLAFVTSWATNGHIYDYLAHNPDADRVLLCSDTAAGVQYLHKNDIVHGDLKGCNVLVDGSGRAVIADFGLSNVNDPYILKWTSESTIGSKRGTTRWHAPELLAIESEDTVEASSVYNTQASDVFAWSNVCYEIFTGRVPFFEVSHPVQVMTRIMQGGTPTRPNDDDPAWQQNGLNHRIWNLMRDCWSFEPLQRPDMTAVISRLDAEKRMDTRPPGEWDENSSVRFRNADKVREVQDLPEFWDGVQSLLLEVVPDLESKEAEEDI